jgi:hypothetical protein
MNPKEFLLHECRNIRSTLREVLRHDYFAGSSKDFYKEYCDRLSVLESMLKPADPTDISLLRTLAIEVSLLSMSVHNVERSHGGEFPWPFTEYLTDLATPLCKENLSRSGDETKNSDEPIIRVYADGGLVSYKINLESDLSVLDVDRRIFTIVFPRTLKHHVLLHSIFGHEIGHAAWTIPKHGAALRGKVLAPLRSEGPLNSTSQATHWLRSPSAPPQIDEFRKEYGDDFYTDIDAEQLDSWFQEFMCDLFGLVTFGPSFLAAHKTLLLALDPTGHRWGPQHPPYVCRRAMLWHACQHLGWDKFAATIKNENLRGTIANFLGQQLGLTAPGPWEDVFRPAKIASAIDGLKAVLDAAGSSHYTLPNEGAVLPLVAMLGDRIPPCGSDLSGTDEPINRKMDFRDILFAGWAVAEASIPVESDEDRERRFLQINKLCELGLLQQRAIDLHRPGAQGEPT